MDQTTEREIERQHQLFRTAFDVFLAELKNSKLEPSESYLPHDFEKQVDARQWKLQAINRMIKGELNELINDLNEWHDSLLRWYAWNKVIRSYSSNLLDTWKLRSEFLGTRVFYCLFQPASNRDRLTFVVTNAMHQVRLMVEEDYEDHLKGDPATLDELTKSKFLSRRKKENRLSSLISIWKEGTDFMEFLRAIDDEAYKKETLNYRNRHSHIIGPRLGLGHVQFVTRRVTQYTDINKQPDGSYEPILTDRVSACYSAGRGTPPLDLEKAHAANLEQYRRVRKCYESYRKLLATGMEVMPLAS